MHCGVTMVYSPKMQKCVSVPAVEYEDVRIMPDGYVSSAGIMLSAAETTFRDTGAMPVLNNACLAYNGRYFDATVSGHEERISLDELLVRFVGDAGVSQSLTGYYHIGETVGGRKMIDVLVITGREFVN